MRSVDTSELKQLPVSERGRSADPLMDILILNGLETPAEAAVRAQHEELKQVEKVAREKRLAIIEDALITIGSVFREAITGGLKQECGFDVTEIMEARLKNTNSRPEYVSSLALRSAENVSRVLAVFGWKCELVCDQGASQVKTFYHFSPLTPQDRARELSDIEIADRLNAEPSTRVQKPPSGPSEDAVIIADLLANGLDHQQASKAYLHELVKAGGLFEAAYRARQAWQVVHADYWKQKLCELMINDREVMTSDFKINITHLLSDYANQNEKNILSPELFIEKQQTIIEALFREAGWSARFEAKEEMTGTFPFKKRATTVNLLLEKGAEPTVNANHSNSNAEIPSYKEFLTRYVRSQMPEKQTCVTELLAKIDHAIKFGTLESDCSRSADITSIIQDNFARRQFKDESMKLYLRTLQSILNFKLREHNWLVALTHDMKPPTFLRAAELERSEVKIRVRKPTK